MNLFIEQDPVDVSIENERNALEVLNSAAAWLVAWDFSVLAVEIDGKSYEPGMLTELAAIPLDTITTYRLRVRSFREQAIHELEVCSDYLALLHQAFERGNEPLVNDILGEYSFVHPVLTRYLGDLFSQTNDAQKISTLFETWKGLQNPADKTAFGQEILRALEKVQLILADRMHELADTRGRARDLAPQLKETAARLQDVPLFLQTSKDREAMQLVMDFSSQVQTALRLASYLKPDAATRLADWGTRYEELARKLHEELKNLVDAFSAQDTILIGDLLEYELSPLAGEAAQLLEQAA